VFLHAHLPAATVQVNNQPDVLFAVLHVNNTMIGPDIRFLCDITRCDTSQQSCPSFTKPCMLSVGRCNRHSSKPYSHASFTLCWVCKTRATTAAHHACTATFVCWPASAITEKHLVEMVPALRLNFAQSRHQLHRMLLQDSAGWPVHSTGCKHMGNSWCSCLAHS